MKDIVSIIVPVYNTGEYLRPCLQSLRGQTYQDLEIILVDDGSTDGSGALCDEFALRDSRVKVIHQENGGVSRARNRGLDIACGEWVLFVDSDDWVLPDYCGDMLCAVLAENADSVIARPEMDGLPEIHIYTPEEIEKLKLGCMAYHGMGFDCNIDGPWGKLFRRSIIEAHDIRFPEKLSRSEDAWFCATFYEHARKLCCLNRFGYVHNERPGSLCCRFAPDSLDMLERILEENRAWVERFHPGERAYLEAVSHRVLPGIIECERQYFLHPDYDGSVWHRAREYRRFLKRPVIRRALRGTAPAMIENTRMRLRLFLYRMGLGGLFFVMKAKQS